MKSVAVFFGGKSVEHDVSVITGVMTSNCFNGRDYRAIPVYVDKNGVWYTGESLLDPDGYKNLDFKKLKKVTLTGGSNVLFEIKRNKLKAVAVLSAAINCMHGGYGEDGSLSGLLNFCGIPLASPSVLPAAVSMDKSFTKTVLKGLKVKTLPSVTVRSEKEWNAIKLKPDYPVIVKPVLLGSSIGISRAENSKELERAVSYGLKFCDRVIIERCLGDFIEINCAAYLKKDGTIAVSECERPVGRTKILSFTDKYESGKRVFPADIDKKYSDKIKATTEKVYRALGFSGVIRIDYFLSDGEIYLNEINSVPGSLAYYLFGDTLYSFSKMLTEIVAVAEQKFAKDGTVTTEYKSGILDGVGSKGAKGRSNRL
ncbi:MAG: ATP-grasp domain-containing protein [Clostridia bacterium]|nr:ATP-grasp domain-containing protein [Clostridia bacterium]